MPTKKTLEKYLIQLRRIEAHRELGAERNIRRIYKTLLKDLQGFIGSEYAQLAGNDVLTFADLQKAGEYARFLEQVEISVNNIFPQVRKEITSTVEETYKATYQGMVDAVEKSVDIPSLYENLEGVRAITPETVKRIVENPVAGLTLTDRLEKNRQDVVYNIKQQIGIGLTQGDRYSTMARRISDQLDMDYRKAIRIVRTEAHKVREAGHYDAASEIDTVLKNESDLRMVKTWRTMRDEAVRPQRRSYKRKAGAKARKTNTAGKRSYLNGPNHVKMEGQTVLVDEEFDLGNGVKAFVPGQSGVAGHDINCRCYASYDLMDDADFFKKTGKYFENVESTDPIIEQEEKNNITNQISELLGIDKESININDLPLSAHRNIYHAVKNSVTRYPKLRGKIKQIVYDDSITAIAKSKSLEGIILISKEFKDMKKLANTYKYSVKLNLYPKGTTAASIVTHEIGHIFDGLFTLRGLYGASSTSFGLMRTSVRVRNEVLYRLGCRSADPDVQEKFILEHISEYACRNEREFFAECYSEYVTSPNPRKAARIFGEIFEEIMEEL